MRAKWLVASVVVCLGVALFFVFTSGLVTNGGRVPGPAYGFSFLVAAPTNGCAQANGHLNNGQVNGNADVNGQFNNGQFGVTGWGGNLGIMGLGKWPLP